MYVDSKRGAAGSPRELGGGELRREARASVPASSAAAPGKMKAGAGAAAAGSPGPAADTTDPAARKPSERQAVLEQLLILASNAFLVGTAETSMM